MKEYIYFTITAHLTNEQVVAVDVIIFEQVYKIERKVYRRILGPVYDNEKENWRILTNKEIYASVKKPTIIETICLNRLRWFGHA
jgi:hypothetical protein